MGAVRTRGGVDTQSRALGMKVGVGKGCPGPRGGQVPAPRRPSCQPSQDSAGVGLTTSCSRHLPWAEVAPSGAVR